MANPLWHLGLSLMFVAPISMEAEPGWEKSLRLTQAASRNQDTTAQKLIVEGNALFERGDKESLERALIIFDEVIRISEATDQKIWTALALLLSGAC
jgi:hypothetical protein